MSLHLSVESLDGIPEPVRDFYEDAGNGTFRLKVEGLEDTEGLKTSLAKANKEAAERRTALSTWKALGKTPEEIQALIAAADEAEAKRQEAEDAKAKAAGDFDALMKKRDATYGKEREGFEKRIADLTAAMQQIEASERSAVVTSNLMAALNKAGVTQEGVDLLPDRLAGRVRIVVEDGKRVTQFLSADGATPMAGNASFDDLVKEASTKWPSLFKGSGAGGGGKPPNSGGGAGARSMSVAEFSSLSPQERAARMADGYTLID